MAGTPIIVPFVGDIGPLQKSVRAANKDLKSFGRRSNAVLRGVGKAFAGLAAGAGAFGAAGVKAFTEFDKQVREVATLLGEVDQEIVDSLNSTISKVVADFGQGGDKVAKAFYDSISAGVPQEAVDGFVRSAAKLATAGATEVSTAVDLMTSSLNAFKIDAKDADKVADIMFSTVKAGKTTVDEIASSFSQVGPVAAAVGIELSDVTSWLGTLTLSGTPTKQAATQIKAALTELSKPSSKISTAFAKITGKSFPDFIAEGGSVANAMRAVEEAGRSADGGLAALFGSVDAYQSVLGITGQNSEMFAGTLESIAASAGSVEVAFGTMSESAAFQFGKFQRTITNLKQDVGAALLPAVTAVLPVLVPVVEAFAQFAAELLTGLIPALRPLLDALLPVALELFGALTPLAVAVAGALSEIAAPLGQLITALLPPLVQWIELASAGLSSLAPYIAQAVEWFAVFAGSNPEIVFVALGTAIAAVLIPKVVALGAALAALALNPVGAVITALAALVIGVKAAYDNFEGFRNVCDAVGRFLRDKLWPVLKEIFNWLKLAAKIYITPIVLQFKAVRSVVQGLIGFFQGAVVPVFKQVFGRLKEVVRVYSGFVKLQFEIVKTVIKGVISFFKSTMIPAFKSAWRTIKKPIDVVRSAVEKVIDAIKWVVNNIGRIGDAAKSIPGVGAVTGGVGKVVGGIGKIFGFAKGGIVTKPTMGLVGEAGAEAIIPLKEIDKVVALQQDELEKIHGLLEENNSDAIAAMTRISDEELLSSLEQAKANLDALNETKHVLSDDLGKVQIAAGGVAAQVRGAHLDAKDIGRRVVSLLSNILTTVRNLGNSATGGRRGRGGGVYGQVRNPDGSINTRLTDLNRRGYQFDEADAAAAWVSPEQIAWQNYLGGTGPKVPMPKMAKGGIVKRPTIAMIGEAGPEAVVPLGRKAMGGMTINIHVEGGLDTGEAIGRNVELALQRWMRVNGPLELEVV